MEAVLRRTRRYLLEVVFMDGDPLYVMSVALTPIMMSTGILMLNNLKAIVIVL